MPIRCEIVSQDRSVFSGDVDIVILPGSDGVMGILPHHSLVLTTLHFGVITVRRGKEEMMFTVAGGVAEVQPDQVTVLADAAENVVEIDVQRAEAARQRAEAMLKQIDRVDSDEYIKIQNTLRKSTLRLDAVRRYRRGQNRSI